MAEAHRTQLEELSEADQRRLRDAHARLRDAVTAYEPFIGVPLDGVTEVPVHRADEMQRAQREVESAEADLWQVRERLLGWPRPAGALSATQTAEWFFDDDLYEEPARSSRSSVGRSSLGDADQG